MTKAAIVGLSGAELTPEEAAILRADPPVGVILFARNVVDPDQVRVLIGAVRGAAGLGVLLMVDQEGGRVARLRPPHWRRHPPAGDIGRLFETAPDDGERAAFLTGALIGAECGAAGFDVIAAPVLDRRLPGADAVIGDRAFSADPYAVARLGGAFAAGVLAAGAQPVMKHAPGHGRARADSHFALPVVDGAEAEADTLPFRLNAILPWAMTSHILYPDWDAAHPATLSRTIINDVIRGRIGFEGVLVSDDLAMRALSGAPADLARAALAAGCDLALYCAGDLGPTAELLRSCPAIGPATEHRLEAARAAASSGHRPHDMSALAAERDRLFA